MTWDFALGNSRRSARSRSSPIDSHCVGFAALLTFFVITDDEKTRGRILMRSKAALGDKAIDALWFGFWFALSACWILSAAAVVGATFDEPVYLELGAVFWRTGSHQELMRLGTMPLPMDLSTFPIFVYERWTGTRLDLFADMFPQLLFWCRAMILIFWAILLVSARVVGGSIGGPWGGRLALAFIACEPNFLAHASLMTADIAMTAMLLPTLYLFARGRTENWIWRVAVPALMFGLCLLAKASAVVYVPVGMFIIEVTRLWRDGVYPRRDESTAASRIGRLWQAFVQPLVPFIRDSVKIGVLGLLLAFVYCGSDFQAEKSWVKWSNELPDGPLKSVMVPLSENVKIFNNAGVGIVRQIGHNIRGHGAYLLGRTEPRSIWYYYPVLLTIKLTIPILVLPALLLVLDRKSLLNWACLVAAVLLIYSLNCRVQIGIRLMLPWIAVGIAGVCAAAAVSCAKRPQGWRTSAIAAVCCLGLVWNVGVAAAHWPNGLSYVNELWGGAAEGYRLISDSNYDWGQGVPELDRWLAEHQNPPTDLFYFGADPRVKTLPVRLGRYDTLTYDEFLARVRGRYFAIGAVLLYGAYTDRDSVVIENLRKMRPVDRTQTFLIYDFTRPEALAEGMKLSGQ
jgi:hypothetical protein